MKSPSEGAENSRPPRRIGGRLHGLWQNRKFGFDCGRESRGLGLGLAVPWRQWPLQEVLHAHHCARATYGRTATGDCSRGAVAEMTPSEIFFTGFLSRSYNIGCWLFGWISSEFCGEYARAIFIIASKDVSEWLHACVRWSVAFRMGFIVLRFFYVESFDLFIRVLISMVFSDSAMCMFEFRD